jgi:hypothetical protein
MVRKWGNFGSGAMISEASKAVVENARRIYESQLLTELEEKHFGEYVCIEPVSANYSRMNRE